MQVYHSLLSSRPGPDAFTLQSIVPHSVSRNPSHSIPLNLKIHAETESDKRQDASPSSRPYNPLNPYSPDVSSCTHPSPFEARGRQGSRPWEGAALWSAGLLLVAANQGAGVVEGTVQTPTYQVSEVSRRLEDVTSVTKTLEWEEGGRLWSDQTMVVTYASGPPYTFESYSPHEGTFMGVPVLWEGVDSYGKLGGDFKRDFLNETCGRDLDWMSCMESEAASIRAPCGTCDPLSNNVL